MHALRTRGMETTHCRKRADIPERTCCASAGWLGAACSTAATIAAWSPISTSGGKRCSAACKYSTRATLAWSALTLLLSATDTARHTRCATCAFTPSSRSRSPFPPASSAVAGGRLSRP
eukprot:3939638-Rhodomonas_salina.1